MSLILAACSCQTTTWTSGVPNLHQVEPGLYRGGQPTEQGWAYLKSLGVTNVVKLNEEREGSDAGAVKAGMTVVYLPISVGQQIEGGPKLSTVAKAVANMQPGVFVHCSHGQDRTGLVVGVYRVWIDKWSKERAYQEMLANGFHPLLKGLWDYWQEKVPEGKL